MPYIEPQDRPELNPIVELMQEIGIKADGDLNYILFKYCKYNVAKGYNSYKNFRAELRECADEIGRRLMAEHEDYVKEKNGDV